MFVALPTEIHEQIDALIDCAIAKCPEAAGARADLRAQLVSYFCDWNHLPTPENISIEKVQRVESVGTVSVHESPDVSTRGSGDEAGTMQPASTSNEPATPC